MLKPTNYDNLIVDDYSPIKLGGHYLEIIDVKESVSRSGNPLLVIHFDFAENDVCSLGLKKFVVAVEQSNPGFKVNWIEGPDFAKQFAGKKIGGVFGNLEEEYNGEYFIRRKLRWFCNCSAVPDAQIPKDKLLKKHSPEFSEPITELNSAPSDDDPF